MNNDLQSITITVQVQSLNKTIHTFANEYRNLMMLLVNSIYFDDFGECGGMGRCCTCVVKIKSNQALPQSDGNEKRTLSRHDFNPDETRLACQIPINEKLDQATVVIV